MQEAANFGQTSANFLQNKLWVLEF